MKYGTLAACPVTSIDTPASVEKEPVMRRVKAFTLVELLVVVGMIAVLIALLFPVFHKAWQQAQQVTCASNMRQIALGTLAYAAENGGRLPVPLGIAPASAKPLPYEAIGLDVVGMLNWDRGQLWPYISKDRGIRSRIFLCPSDTEPRWTQELDGSFNPKFPRNFSYSFNGILNTMSQSRPFLPYGVRLTQVHHPSVKLLLMDMAGPTGPSTIVSSASGPIGPDAVVVFLATRHSGLCNVACFDGHIETLSPALFKNPTRNGGTYIATPNYEHYVDIFSDQ